MSSVPPVSHDVVYGLVGGCLLGLGVGVGLGQLEAVRRLVEKIRGGEDVEEGEEGVVGMALEAIGLGGQRSRDGDVDGTERGGGGEDSEEESGDEEEEESESEEEEGKRDDEERLKMVFVVRTDLKMGKGKIAAQVGHAAIGLYRRALRHPVWAQWVLDWQDRGVAKITLRATSEELMDRVIEAAARDGLPAFVVKDAGHTQVASGTRTVGGIGPAPEHLIDKISGPRGEIPLKLLS